MTQITETILGKVATFEMGQAPPGSECNKEGKGTLFVKAGEFGQLYPEQKEWTTKPLKFGKRGDVFICVVGATAGKLNLGIDCAIGRSVAAIRPNDDIDTRFVYYQLQPFILKLRSASSGSAQGVISKQQLHEVPFRVVEFDKQREIVAEIEKQFSRLDEAVASLKRTKANLKRYKAAVLKAAVEGKLTEDWRKAHPDVEPASKLLERVLLGAWVKDGRKDSELLDVSRLQELPKGWRWVRIEDVGRVQLGRQRAPKYHSGKSMRPYLRVQNVFEDRIDLEDVMEMDFPAEDYKKFKLEAGDILLNEGQSPELLGRPAIYRGELPGSCFTNTLIRFRAYAPLTPEYPLIVFRTYMRTGRFTREGTITTNIAHLSAGRFAKIEFPLPPLEEQREIVAEVERCLSVIDELEATVESNLTRADRLRQSILSQAFSGKLVLAGSPSSRNVPQDLPVAAEPLAPYGVIQ